MTTEIPLDRQIACVRREIGMRERVYPRWIESGKMKQAQADSEIEAMRAVLGTLMGLHDAQVINPPGLFR